MLFLKTIQLTPEQIGVLCGKWYAAINTMDVEKTVTLKNELDVHIKDIHSHKVRALYDLIRFRYDLFIENAQRSKKVNDWTPDDSITFYSLFFEGQDLFQRQFFKNALTVFESAKTKLFAIKDPSEQAEFYFFYAQTFYRLDQYDKSELNIKKAIDLYGESAIFNDKRKNCLIIMGAVASEKNDYIKAKAIYKQVLEDTSINNRTYGFVNRALALNESIVGNFIDAEHYYKEALKSKGFKETTAAAKSKIELATILYYLDRNNASQVLDEGTEQIENSSDREYLIRADIVYHLYQDYNDQKVEKQLNNMIESGFIFGANEVAQDIARYHKKMGNTALAIKYTDVNLNQNVGVY